MVTYLGINYNDSAYNSFKNRLGYAGALKKEGESGFATLRRAPQKGAKKGRQAPKRAKKCQFWPLFY